jgi:hypothetical protein
MREPCFRTEPCRHVVQLALTKGIDWILSEYRSQAPPPSEALTGEIVDTPFHGLAEFASKTGGATGDRVAREKPPVNPGHATRRYLVG